LSATKLKTVFDGSKDEGLLQIGKAEKQAKLQPKLVDVTAPMHFFTRLYST